MKKNVLILTLCLFFIAIGFVFIFAYQQPKDLKHQTGNVLSFYQHDEKWFDSLLGGSKGSYFNVKLEDGSFYEATGICYDNIDRELFENVRVGGNITVTYFEKSGGLRKICALEYNGKTYLLLDDVLSEYSQNEKTAHLVGFATIALSISAGVVLFIINNKKKR